MDCPDWEYTDIDGANEILEGRSARILFDVRSDPAFRDSVPYDTRPVHATMFRGLVPKGYTYYAGNYRGSSFRCLQFVRVTIDGDPRVGIPPDYVSSGVDSLVETFDNHIRSFDIAFQLPNSHLPMNEKVLYVVAFACRCFVEFLRIHPYLNGNGHMARLFLICILGRYSLWPKAFPFNARPPDPPYSELIRQYRDGNKRDLERFVLQCLTGRFQTA